MVTLIGSAIGWGGYLLIAYGWSQVRGCNIGLRDLAWPGRTIACNPDTPRGAQTSGPGSNTIPPPAKNKNALPPANKNPAKGGKGVAPGSATGNPNSVPPGGIGYRIPTPIK